MRPVQLCLIICLLLASSVVLSGPSSAADKIAFVGDYYKVEGEPLLRATAVNPALPPGENVTLRLVLANDGWVEELIPGDIAPGEEAEAAQEMLAELRCVDAANLRARLSSSGPIRVVSGPVSLDSLPAGETVPLEFSLQVGESADGVYRLPLSLEYEHQIDVSISNGQPSPLYLPAEKKLEIKVEVEEVSSIAVVRARSDLRPGKNGTVTLAIRNTGMKTLVGCTAQLATDPPLDPLDDEVPLGDLGPGQVVMARFGGGVDEDAGAQEYDLDCNIDHLMGVASAPFTVVVEKDSMMSLLAVPLVIAVLAGLVLIQRRRSRQVKSLRRRRWPF